jgi:hypothetical protein
MTPRRSTSSGSPRGHSMPIERKAREFSGPVLFDQDEFFGITEVFHPMGQGQWAMETIQDVEPILENNKALFTHDDGYTPTREMRRVASIPLIVVHKWLKMGIDVNNPDHWPKVKELLNSSDYLYLRTAPGRL